MMDKREKELFELLKAHPDGLRLREMGTYLRMWHIDCLDVLRPLHAKGYVTEKFVEGDRANGEFGYIRYKWSGKEWRG